MKRPLRRADKVGARIAVIFGGDELAKGTLQLKDLDKGEQSEVARTALGEELKTRLG